MSAMKSIIELLSLKGAGILFATAAGAFDNPLAAAQKYG
jgi:hypothetical protein